MPLTEATEPQQILKEVFGFDSFRGEQETIIESVSAGGDALVLMPTGAGKSLCYQLPAISRQRASHGVTVVVSPLRRHSSTRRLTPQSLCVRESECSLARSR
jgi:ATP-dependent DNA helicase RecQ